jgi:hypothetical protein
MKNQTQLITILKNQIKKLEKELEKTRIANMKLRVKLKKLKEFYSKCNRLMEE